VVHHGDEVVLRTHTEFPYGGLVRVVVECDGPAEWELALRVPGWSSRTTLEVDGVAVRVDDADGYLRVRRSWQGRHEVLLELDVRPRIVVPHPRIDAVRGCVAIVRGPLVYALEQADVPHGIALEDLVLVALDTPAADAPQDEQSPGSARVQVIACPRAPRSAALYAPQQPVAESPPLRLPLVPYYRWGNRGLGAMRVWIPLAADFTTSPDLTHAQPPDADRHSSTSQLRKEPS
jgi:DUF1680 family protein